MRNAVIVAFVALNTVIFGYNGYELAIQSRQYLVCRLLLEKKK